ncbi:MAG: hypothetical protein ACRD28_08760 [Acidobacteriaceae bacterium]
MSKHHSATRTPRRRGAAQVDRGDLIQVDGYQLFFPESVASVSGLGCTEAGLCTTVLFELAGRLSDARVMMGTHVFDPLIALADLVLLFGMIIVLLLVRNRRATEQGLVRRI